MRSRTYKLKLILVILMLAFIWGHSMLSGEISGRESMRVLELVRPLIALLRGWLANVGVMADELTVLRKLAHFSEYAALGFLMFLLFVRPGGRGRYVLPAALCLATAGVDEGIIQMLAADRGPAARDVVIDFCGSCLGIVCAALLVWLIGGVFRRKRTL